MCYIIVPPERNFVPSLTRGNPKILPQEDLAGPYSENVTEVFTCIIRNVLPGKSSTSFKFYLGNESRLQSKDGTGEIQEKDESDGTKYVEWNFTTLFNRSDNGVKFSCTVDWKAGQYEKIGLKSTLRGPVQVKCKYPTI